MWKLILLEAILVPCVLRMGYLHVKRSLDGTYVRWAEEEKARKGND